MEKYGTDRIANLIAEECSIMRRISTAMSTNDKCASDMSKLESDLRTIREQIRNLEAEKIAQD